MLNIDGRHMADFPFKGLKLIYDLISFEGEPFLRHYQDYRKKNIISYLVDDYNSDTRWLYFSITEEELVSYLSNSISLKELLLNLNTDLKFFIDFDNSNNVSKITLIQDDLDPRYLPDDDSFFPIEIPDVYTEQIKKHNVINIFLPNGVFLKADRIERNKNHGLIRAIDASELLGAVGESWENKLKKDVETKFISLGITDGTRINKGKTEVIKSYSLDIARLKVASFAVALYPNPIIDITDNSILSKEWLLDTLREFKEDVIEIDKKTDAEVAAITGKYRDVTDMKAIYNPLIKLYENKQVTISLTDIHFKEIRVLKPIKENIKARLIVDKPKKPEDDENTTERVIKAKFNEKTHKPVISSGFTLFDLDTKVTWETTKIEYKGIVFQLTFPLVFKYSLTNGVTILENSLLDIFATGEEKTEVVNDVYRQFFEVFNALMSIDDERELNDDQIRRKRYLELITGYEA